MNKDHIEDVLQTSNPKFLWNAFIWDETPEGHEYWSDIANGRKPLDQKARDKLEVMLELSSTR